MPLRTCWLKIIASVPQRYALDLDVHPSVLIEALSKLPEFDGIIDAPLSSWHVHIVTSSREMATPDNEVPGDTVISSRLDGLSDKACICLRPRDDEDGDEVAPGMSDSRWQMRLPPRHGPGATTRAIHRPLSLAALKRVHALSSLFAHPALQMSSQGFTLTGSRQYC